MGKGLRITVAFSPSADVVQWVELEMAEGSTLSDALQRCGWFQAGRLPPELTAGVWGRSRPHDHVLGDGDRVEVWRGLTVDPKEARRLRYRGKR